MKREIELEKSDENSKKIKLEEATENPFNVSHISPNSLSIFAQPQKKSYYLKKENLISLSLIRSFYFELNQAFHSDSDQMQKVSDYLYFDRNQLERLEKILQNKDFKPDLPLFLTRLESESNRFYRDHAGIFPIHTVCILYSEGKLSFNDTEYLLSLLLEKGADPFCFHEGQNYVGENCFDILIQSDQCESNQLIKLILEKCPHLDVNKKGFNGFTPLMHTVINIEPYETEDHKIQLSEKFNVHRRIIQNIITFLTYGANIDIVYKNNDYIFPEKNGLTIKQLMPDFHDKLFKPDDCSGGEWLQRTYEKYHRNPEINNLINHKHVQK